MDKLAPSFKGSNAVEIRKDNDDDQAYSTDTKSPWKKATSMFQIPLGQRGPVVAIQRPSGPSPHYNRVAGATFPAVSIQMPSATVPSPHYNRTVGANLSIISETTEPQKTMGRWLNYTPMFASLQSSLSSATKYTRSTSGQVASQKFEMSAAVEQSVDSHIVLSSATVEGKKDTSFTARSIDLEAQKSDSSS
ncbi:hypothetical protein N7478_006747 [Penicillium angulare]|uniref:uncharacterized protein n=1 Tax=Penicillium angulare TaxID=116970 RepID=UPI002541E1DB|nr:uncharacterized protein N7478_006747 [Penicillium angulare]KAJ5281375.1 hypothetical protein N7478_006747 [Penicillium angulare]